MLPSAIKRQMRNAAFMLGSKRISMTSEKPSALEDDDDLDDPSETALQWVLAKPAQLVIVDDVNAHASFASIVLACPQEDLLEIFAEAGLFLASVIDVCRSSALSE